MDKEKIKIMFIIDFLDYGGAPKMLTEIANNLYLDGFEVTVHSYANDSIHYKLADGVEYIPGSKLSDNYYLRHFLKISKVRKTIKTVSPDIVISFMPNPNVLSLLGTWFTKIPTIISERGDPGIYRGIIPKIKYFFYNYADVLVCQTEGAKEFFNKRIQKKTVVIPNSVTMARTEITPIYQRRKEIAFVGRFQIVQKRQDLMILAFKEIVKNYPDYKLVFYGDGDDQITVEEMAKCEGLLESVVFAGRVDDVKSAIQNARIYVLTSDYEGIPNTLVEAMCLGLPVVATDCTPGGSRLLINNYENGIIVPRGDVEKIAEAIEYLLIHPEEAEQMGRKAQGLLDEYSTDIITEMWKKAIQDVRAKIKGKYYK